VAPAAFALVVTARGLARRQRRAWLLALSLMAVLTALHIERRFDQGAILTGVAMVALLARRADFRLRGDPSAQPRVAVHALVAAGGILVYGLATLYVNRLMVDQPYTLGFSLREIGRLLLGLNLDRDVHLSGSIG